MLRNRALLTVIALMIFAVVCAAKTKKISGKIVGYDFMHHASKATSDTQNQEVVILETPNEKQKYVKVMFSSLGTTQIEPKYFDGAQALDAEVFRDHTCDEKSPIFASQVSMEQIAGTYQLTDAYKTHPPSRIKHLDCYVAIYRKKK